MAAHPAVYLQIRDPARIDELRGTRSYATIAAGAQCSTTFIHALARGGVTRCSPGLAARIEAVLGAARGELFGLSDQDRELLSSYVCSGSR